MSDLPPHPIAWRSVAVGGVLFVAGFLAFLFGLRGSGVGQVLLIAVGVIFAITGAWMQWRHIMPSRR